MAFRLCCALVASAALARAAEIDTSVGTFEIDNGDYLFDGKKMETKKDIDVTVDRDSNNAIPAKMLETGYSIGYRSAEQKLAGDLVSKTNSNAALKQILALVVARKDQLEKDIVGVGEADKAYTKQLASEQTPDPTVTGVTGCPGGTCSAHGGVDHVVTLKGETYGDVSGAVECSYKYGSNDPITTSGTGKQTGVSGKNSLVLCKTPTFQPAPAKAFEVTVGVSQLGTALKAAAGVNAVLKFKAGAPALFAPEGVAEKPFPKVLEVASSSGLTTVGTTDHLIMDFDVYDPDFDPKNYKNNLKDGSVKVVNSANKLYPSTGTIKYVSGGEDGVYRVRMDIVVKVPQGKILKETATMQITLTDAVSSATTDVPIIMDIRPPNLIMKFCTTAGSTARTWYDKNWWESGREFNADKAKSGTWEAFRDDIKTSAFTQPIGAILNIVHLKGAQVVATASYDINAKYQATSLYDLTKDNKYMNSNIGKKHSGRSFGAIKGKYGDGNQDGNCRPNAGDGFIDNNWDLKVRVRNLYNNQDEWDRIAFNYNKCKGGHIFGGIGGTHYHGGWAIAYEAMPVVGYCNTWNGYGRDGSNSNNPRNGAYPYSRCGGSKRRDPIDVAIYRIDP